MLQGIGCSTLIVQKSCKCMHTLQHKCNSWQNQLLPYLCTAVMVCNSRGNADRMPILGGSRDPCQLSKGGQESRERRQRRQLAAHATGHAIKEPRRREEVRRDIARRG